MVRLAVLALSTSRGRQWSMVEESYLFTKLLTSLAKTKDPSVDYCVFVGVDFDDALFANRIGSSEHFEGIEVRWLGLREPKGHVTRMWNRLFELALLESFFLILQRGD
jgi:hypothetical protein